MLSAIMNYTYFISSGIDSRVMVYLSSAILLEAVIGIVGNLAVLLIVVCYKDMHTLINLSFANLAVADLCVLSLDAIPTAMDLMGYNISSKLGCRIPYFIKWVSGQVTCITLAHLSYDRYRVVVRPFNSLKHRRSRDVWAIMFSMWFVSILLQSPVIYVGTPTEDGLCQEYAPEVGVKIFFSAETVSLFLLPLVLMCFCLYHIWKTLANSRRVTCKYGWQPGSCQRVNGPALALNRKLWRQRKRGIRVVTTTVLVFAMGYMPIHSVHLWYAYSGKPIREHDVLYVLIHTVANTVMYFSNFMNPYIYAFLGKGFRNHLKNSLLCVHIRKKLRDIANRRKSNSIWL